VTQYRKRKRASVRRVNAQEKRRKLVENSSNGEQQKPSQTLQSLLSNSPSPASTQQTPSASTQPIPPTVTKETDSESGTEDGQLCRHQLTNGKSLEIEQHMPKEISQTTLSGMPNEQYQCFFIAAINLLVHGFGREAALDMTYNEHLGKYNDKFAGGSTKLRNLFTKLLDNQDITSVDVANTIDLGCYYFEKDGKSYPYHKDCSTEQQEVEMVISCLIETCWPHFMINLTSKHQDEDGEGKRTVTSKEPFITLYPLPRTPTAMNRKSAQVVGDMVVALNQLQRPEPESSETNVFIEPLSNFFIVKVSRVVNSNYNNQSKEEKDYTNVYRSEAISVQSSEDSKVYGKLQSFVVHIGNNIGSNAGHFVCYSRCPKNNNQWVLHNDQEVTTPAIEGDEMILYACFLLYEVCSEDIYEKTLTAAAIRLLRVNVRRHEIFHAMAALTQCSPKPITGTDENYETSRPQKWINACKVKLRKELLSQSGHLNKSKHFVNEIVTHIIVKPITYQLKRAGKTIDVCCDDFLNCQSRKLYEAAFFGERMPLFYENCDNVLDGLLREKFNKLLMEVSQETISNMRNRAKQLICNKENLSFIPMPSSRICSNCHRMQYDEGNSFSSCLCLVEDAVTDTLATGEAEVP
jgi:hypothetical protein